MGENCNKTMLALVNTVNNFTTYDPASGEYKLEKHLENENYLWASRMTSDKTYIDDIYFTPHSNLNNYAEKDNECILNAVSKSRDANSFLRSKGEQKEAEADLSLDWASVA